MLEAGQAQAEEDGAVKVAGFAIHPAMPRPRAVRGTSPRLEPGHAAGATPETPMDRRSEAGSAWRVRMFGHDFAAGPAAGILAASAMQPSAGPRLIVTANIDHIVLLSENAAFRQAYAGAVARTLDGTPLVWLARLRGQPAARVTGHDLLAHALFARPVEGRRVFLVCSRDAVAEAIRDRLKRSGYDADAVATCVPPFGFDDDAEYGRALSARIREHGTTLLVMGVGAPRSEVWVTRQGAALGTPLVLAVGEAVNVAAGLVPRAPVMLQRAGLEWAFRFAFAPRRLFRRYFVRSWRFLALLRGEIGSRDAA
ncbi:MULTISPECIES: WecB/TagA/CpsF family glycosyltransferase [unclassified Methylobacterium]|uniref:WecB/TagA/CpsF family glycosyltransferase n=1 Tax=unclassified Methylobacterium TaxID=2615210 RepID=UPI001FEFE0F2|nr:MULTISPECIES: WecB/TagA/CpsF family glycosyltransferase [unclassified Methylobacterium]